jgi:hypothetical protein
LHRWTGRALLSVIALPAMLGLAMVPAQASGLVKSIVKAPISPNGDVAGAVTDFVINLNVDMDPAAPGKMLRKGQAIKIKLPAAIKPKAVGEFPVRDLFSAPDCKPGLIKCSTGVLLHGWPQHPILPTFPPGKEKQFSIGYDASTNTISYKIEKDLAAAKFSGPGVKQIHLLLFGFRNPETSGNYPVEVAILDANGKALESGGGNLKVLSDPAPSINVTTVFVPGDVKGGKAPNPNTIYQKTKTAQPTPMPWDFLVWDTDGKPFEGISAVQKDGAGGTLMANGKSVGRFTIEAPEGATGQKISGEPSKKIPSTPVIGKTFGAPIPVGRLTTRFTAGSKPGRYTTTFEFDGGTSATMIVDVSG